MHSAGPGAEPTPLGPQAASQATAFCSVPPTVFHDVSLRARLPLSWPLARVLHTPAPLNCFLPQLASCLCHPTVTPGSFLGPPPGRSWPDHRSLGSCDGHLPWAGSWSHRDVIISGSLFQDSWECCSPSVPPATPAVLLRPHRDSALLTSSGRAAYGSATALPKLTRPVHSPSGC